jgi:hypothetical protein
VPTGEWETGYGTYSGANTITRTTVLASSDAGAAVDFDAGTKRVMIALTADFVARTLFAPVVTESGTAADLSPANAGKYQRWTNASAKTLTVEPEATTEQPVDGEWHIRNVGAANLTFAEGAGVTINEPYGGTLVVPSGGTVTLKRVAADTYDLLGVTVPA